MIFMLCVAGIYLCSMFFLLLRLVIGLIHIVVVSSHLMSCSIIPEDFKSAGHFPSPDSVKSRFKAIFNKWPSWIRSCCFSWIFAPGGRLNHEAYNVRTIVFMISENTIPYIGTKILWLTKNDHNSTQKARILSNGSRTLSEQSITLHDGLSTLSDGLRTPTDGLRTLQRRFENF